MPDADDSSDSLDEGGVEDAREASSNESRVPFGFGALRDA